MNPDDSGPEAAGERVPISLLALGTIDAMEYEALVDVEEAAAARRRVFEAEDDREAVEVLQGLSADLSELGRGRLEALSGLATARLDPTRFE